MSALIYYDSEFPVDGAFALAGRTFEDASPILPRPCIREGIPSYPPWAGQFPFGVSFEKAFRTYWGVREFFLSVDLMVQMPGDPEPLPMVETKIILIGGIDSGVNLEQDLVPGPGFSADAGVPWFGQLFQAPGDWLGDPPIFGPNLVREGSTYYPQLYVRYGDSESGGYIFSTDPTNFSGVPLEMKEAVFGSDWFARTSPLYGDEGITVTGTVTLEPSRYWSHGGTWDETTGALLNPDGLLPETYVQYPQP